MTIRESDVEVLDEKMVEVWKLKSPQERLKIAFTMWLAARKQLVNYLHSLHKEWDEDKIQQEVARRLLHGSI